MLIAQVSMTSPNCLVGQVDLRENAEHRVLAPDNHQIPVQCDSLATGSNQQASLLLWRRWCLFAKTFLCFCPEAPRLLFLFLLATFSTSLFQIMNFRKRSLDTLLQLLKGVDELARGAVTIRRRLRHRLLHKQIHFSRELWPHPADRRYLVIHMFDDNIYRRLSFKGWIPGQHFKENRCHRVQVRARVRRTSTFGLLRRDIVRRPHKDVRLSQRNRLPAARQAEIGDFHNILAVNHDILWFDIAMNHAMPVCCIEPLANLPCIVQCAQWFHWTMRQGVVFQILPVYIVHDDIMQIVIVSIVENTYNVRIAQLQKYMRLALETRQKLAIVGEFKMHDFDRVDAIVFGVARNIDSCETASSKLINEFVTSFDDTSYHVTTH